MLGLACGHYYDKINGKELFKYTGKQVMMTTREEQQSQIRKCFVLSVGNIKKHLFFHTILG